MRGGGGVLTYDVVYVHGVHVVPPVVVVSREDRAHDPRVLVEEAHHGLACRCTGEGWGWGGVWEWEREDG